MMTAIWTLAVLFNWFPDKAAALPWPFWVALGVMAVTDMMYYWHTERKK